MHLIRKCCNWLISVKFYKIIILVVLVLVIVPFVAHRYLSQVEQEPYAMYRSKMTFEITEEMVGSTYDLKRRIAEMLRIKTSVSNELRNLEAKSQKLQKEIISYHQRIEETKVEISKQQTELTKLKNSIRQAQLSHLEAVQRNSPELAPPLEILATGEPLKRPFRTSRCSPFHECIDYSRCSLTSGFPVFLYEPETFSSGAASHLKTLVRQAAGYNPHFTKNALAACLFVVLNSEGMIFDQLPYWGGDGRNHLILNLSGRNSTVNSLKWRKIGLAAIAQSDWNLTDFRRKHDLVIPPILGPPGGETWQDYPYMLPARRKYLVSFQGGQTGPEFAHFRKLIENFPSYLSNTSDEFFFKFDCGISGKESDSFFPLCREESANVLTESTFVLIPSSPSFTVSATFQTRLFRALRHGAIPLIVGGDEEGLPFAEMLDWRKMALMTPYARLPELHWLTRAVSDGDLLLMRRQGRAAYDKYFGTGQAVLDTVFAVVRDRIGIPPPAVVDVPSPNIFPEHFQPLKMDPAVPEAEQEENLGPLEPPFNSPKYLRNHTVMRIQGYEIWNDWGDPFRLYPFLPFDPVLPTDAKFMGSHLGFRAINQGAGGAGKEFCENLGGNYPKEQFTIIMLTYEREQVLIDSLSRLRGLPYLNKVLVVWNSPNPPLPDLRWPDIDVPIHVTRAKKNSLNNRFFPYEAIETEAILSVDDDAHLRHDEIIFGFRVWREQRDRVVGFPGRFHALDLNHGGWLYNSNYSCELSMVLTGAAFVHKHYLYLYTYWLPQAIKDMVDEYVNCEDIAMNFLVSHVTRKPPVKVTSRWTFRCPGCPISLSEDETHFNERHKCINFFSKVFGYTPLLNTQFRVDSILFKTRIPHDKQKCFKFI